MKSPFPNLSFAAVFFAVLLYTPAGAAEGRLGAPPILRGGIVIEWLKPDGQAHQAGMRAGDILLSWSCDGAAGQIESPFDLPYVGFEHAPRGTVQVEGFQGGQRRTWVLRRIPWGVATRPNLTDPVLSIYNQAESLAHSGKLTEAVEGWRAAAAVSQQSKVSWLAAWFLSHAGEAMFRAKQMAASDDLYREAVQSAEDAGPVVRGDLFRQWGSQLESREELASAEAIYRRELLEWQLLRAQLLVARALNELATLFLRKGDFSAAESHLLQSLAISQKMAPTSFQAASTYSNLAVLYQDRGDLGKAQRYYQLAIDIERKHFPGTYYLAAVLTDFGILARWRGDMRLADEYHREALKIAQQLKMPGYVATILDNISDCRRDRGDFQGAKNYQKQAFVIRKQLGANIAMASSLASLGRIERLTGNLDAAEDYYRQALEITGKIDPAPPARAVFLSGLGDVFRNRGNAREAEHAYRQALIVMEQFAPRGFDHVEAEASLAATLRAEERLDEAAECYRQALADLEYQTASLEAGEETQARYRALHTSYYREYIDLLVEQKHPELAFEVLESSRARSLFDMLAQAEIDIRQGVDPALLARERDLQQSVNAKSQYRMRLLGQNHTNDKLANLDKQIADLRENYHDIEAEIRASSPGYAALTQPQTLSVKDIQGLLNSETVLLEYSLGEKHSYVWIVAQNTLEVYELPSQAAIERVARQLYRSLTIQTFGVSTDPELARAPREKADALVQKLAISLSQLILVPVKERIRGKRLVIVADGALQYIPFAALPVPGTNSVPLVREHEIVNLPSASVLAEIRRAGAGRSKPTQEVAVLADPVFDGADERLSRAAGDQQKNVRLQEISRRRVPGLVSRSASDIGLTSNGSLHLNRLIYTRDEAKAILALTPKGRTFQALDFAANRSTAVNPKLASYRIIHFATHGFLDSKRPELSGLVLSLVNQQGKPQDGFLGLEDVYNMKLAADLVVLSGCQTGLGEEINGEGLIGLTRGFMYAGASRVVASLWAVSDVATAELMAGFYRAMEVDGMRPAAALRTAQIQMMQQSRWRSPYYWAAFQLQGEWK